MGWANRINSRSNNNTQLIDSIRRKIWLGSRTNSHVSSPSEKVAAITQRPINNSSTFRPVRRN